MNKDDWMLGSIFGALACGLIGLAVHDNKLTKRRREEFSDYVGKTLHGRDLYLDVKQASIKNPKLTVEDRSFAYELLCEFKEDVDNSRTIDEFKTAYDEFQRLYECLTFGESDEIAATLLYYKHTIEIETEKALIRAKRKAEKEQREYERQKTKEERDFILEKTKAYVDGLKSLKTDVNLTVNNEKNA